MMLRSIRSISCLILFVLPIWNLVSCSPVHANREEKLHEVQELLPQVDAEKRRMGWSKCGSWFRWRCGQSKNLSKKIVSLHMPSTGEVWYTSK